MLTAENLSLRYGDGDSVTYAVRDVSLSLPKQGFFGIMGPSGSGKSSLLYLLSGLKTPSEGKIYYGEQSLLDISEKERVQMRRSKFGFVFQQPFLLNYLTARENILVASANSQRDTTTRIQALLEELHIAHLADRYPAHLSGGEKQRVVVARSMIHDPEIIFADEPTAALDHSNGRTVIDLLMKYRTRGTVVVVTHDPSMVAGADHVYQLRDGQMI